jgi:hypothetical protein
MKKCLEFIKNYLAVNVYRRIFVFGILIALGIVILNLVVQIEIFQTGILLCATVALIASLLDSMTERYAFKKKIYEMQVRHFDSLPEGAHVTPTFDAEQLLWLKKKKTMFVGVIMLKVMLVIALFVLLFRF